MADKTEELQKTVAEQQNQIRTLKTAVGRLEQKLNQVSAIARRAQDNVRRLTERVQKIEYRMGRD